MEEIRTLLADRSRDMQEGLTLRSLDKRLDEHLKFDAKEFDEIARQLLELRERLARSDGRASAMDTGNFHIPPTTINLGPQKSKRPSIPPWLKGLSTVGKPILHWLGIIAIVAASHLLARCGIQTQMPPPPASVQH
jgi:hypothetical protein